MNINEITASSENIDEGPRFLTVAEVMKRTMLSRPTIGRYIKKGIIPATRIGGRVLIDAEFLSQLKGRASGSSKEAKA